MLGDVLVDAAAQCRNFRSSPTASPPWEALLVTMLPTALPIGSTKLLFYNELMTIAYYERTKAFSLLYVSILIQSDCSFGLNWKRQL